MRPIFSDAARLAELARICDNVLQPWSNGRAAPRIEHSGISVEEDTMGKTGRKRRARKKKSANHGKRPNA
jgi:hypothetical protein